jgi:hypothetical protein
MMMINILLVKNYPFLMPAQFRLITKRRKVVLGSLWLGKVVIKKVIMEKKCNVKTWIM